jgi:hypothetical protein
MELVVSLTVGNGTITVVSAVSIAGGALGVGPDGVLHVVTNKDVGQDGGRGSASGAGRVHVRKTVAPGTAKYQSQNRIASGL